MNIDKQAELIGARLDVADLKDPDKLAAFLDRFANLWELDHGSTAASPAVLFSQPLELGVGTDLLASLQNLKLGGT
jgi:hypothetical protein